MDRSDRTTKCRVRVWTLVLTAAMLLPSLRRARAAAPTPAGPPCTCMMGMLCPGARRRRPLRVAPPLPARGIAGDGPRAVLAAIARVAQLGRQSCPGAGGAAGLTPAQRSVLRELSQAPALTVGELAARTATAPSSVSEVIKRLVGQGLAERSRCSEDGRSVQVSLTPAGAARLEAEPDADDRLLAGVAAMPDPDQRQLERLLRDLLDTVQRARPA